jgi:cation transport protein ChaC
LTPDAFRHLPGLFDRITPAEHSELRVTPKVLALWDERARGLGRPADWRLSEQAIEASRRAVLQQWERADDLWIYAYGSLMWDPGFHFAEVRRADLDGYQRRFAFKATVGRGSPEHPGLMLTLVRDPGCCAGLVFRIAAEVADAESAILWRREMIRGSYAPLMLPVATPQGVVTAVVFDSNQLHPDYVGELALADTACIIANASGPIGSNRDYLQQMASQLMALQIADPYIDQLLEQVHTIGST